ncbi:hypothetical protein JVT61DRAFT_1973 [Boletus reticuloceps]|uniref:Uncharacterized protein n=1 Tax=Boletus reticuloceps TaxID=495285 RepID=A0A8I2YBU6_9AGAM|nr:hypothetical protein JVT61DRAFT_1973 [Boletus reticuloceps]
MPPHPGTRRAQPSTSGLEHHFASPKRPRDKNKTRRLVTIPGQTARHQQNLARLAELLNRSETQHPDIPPEHAPALPLAPLSDDDFPMDGMDDHPLQYDAEALQTDNPQTPVVPSSIPCQHSRNHVDSTQRLYANWKELLPRLVVLYLQYTTRTLGKPLGIINDRLSFCHSADCERKQTRILCLMFDHFTPIDEFEAAEEAGEDGNKTKTATDIYDDTGVMGLICRHDIPLFFANIDSPVFYDIGCVLARTLTKYDILNVHVTHRLRFATSAMHAYGHEWACQLVYNPRLATGLGLSDGEGTERLWSRLIKLIGIERSSTRQQRIWLIDRQAGVVGHEMRADLGDWIKRRLKRGVQEQGEAAQGQVKESGYSIGDLKEQWALQKDSQLSIRAHAPQRLKKQLDTVISLQSDLDSTERALQAARSLIEKNSEGIGEEALGIMQGLERTHERLMSKVDALYTSLNVQDQFPELKGVDFNFVHLLILARDLKINIRKRAIASFFEWNKLDRAVGGAQKPLGTKLHQQTRKAIAKRQPALLSAIRKFNSYCEHLETLYDPQ